MWPKRLFYKGLPSKSKSGQSPINLKKHYKVKKRGILKKDFSLGLKGINILYINLGQLISRKSYTIPYTLFCNRYLVCCKAS